MYFITYTAGTCSGKKGFGLIITTRNNVIYVRPVTAAWVELVARRSGGRSDGGGSDRVRVPTHTHVNALCIYV